MWIVSWITQRCIERLDRFGLAVVFTTFGFGVDILKLHSYFVSQEFFPQAMARCSPAGVN
jgi:hypothetical protein